jgi:hypothetical protein
MYNQETIKLTLSLVSSFLPPVCWLPVTTPLRRNFHRALQRLAGMGTGWQSQMWFFMD